MENKFLKYSIIIVYLCYAYLLGWQIYYFNQELFYGKALRDADSSFFRYMPAIILLLYGFLLYSNLVLKQRRILIFNSFLAASLLYVYDNTYSMIIATLLSIFGLSGAVIELTRHEQR